MKNAKRAIPLILKHEGGYVNHPSDPGGATNMGITIGTFRRFIKPTGTIDDLKNMTQEQAVHVYKKQYWDAVQADDLPTGVDYTVADFAVNSGPARAARYLQNVVKVPADGVVGPRTIAAAHAKPASFIIQQINDNRLTFMRGIRGGEMWRTFGRGWQARVDDVRKVSLEWSEEEPISGEKLAQWMADNTVQKKRRSVTGIFSNLRQEWKKAWNR